MTREDYVREFQVAMGQDVDVDASEVINFDLSQMRFKLIEEELSELKSAADWGESLNKKRLCNLLKELADLQYVISGFAVTYGLPLEEAFLLVHESNMSKLGDDGKPIYREDGKVLKGPNYKAPDLRGLI